MKRLITLLLTAALLLSCAAGLAEEGAYESFRGWPGQSCYPAVADGGIPGRFLIELPWAWDCGDYSLAYGTPTIIAADDFSGMEHMVLVTEISAESQIDVLMNPSHPLNSFLQDGISVIRGKDTADSRILETMDLHGLKATRVEVLGQGYEMIWIEDGGDLWFFMYPAHPEDRTYTQTVAEMVDSFTVFGARSIGDAAAEDFTYTLGEDGVTIDKYLGSAAYVHIPAEIAGKPVIAVAPQAFYETDVREVSFPDSVTKLGGSVFGGCTELVSVRLPAHLRILPASAFESCFRLYDVQLNPELLCVEPGAFWGNSYLYALNLPDSLVEIQEPNFVMADILSQFGVGEKSAGFATDETGTILFTRDGKRLIFYGRNNDAVRYAVPDGVEHIDSFAFYSCDGLEQVSLPESLREIGVSAFTMTSVREITIPAGVTELGFAYGMRTEEGVSGSAPIGSLTAVRGTPGTAAEEYCSRFGVTFLPVEESAPAAN